MLLFNARCQFMWNFPPVIRAAFGVFASALGLFRSQTHCGFEARFRWRLALCFCCTRSLPSSFFNHLLWFVFCFSLPLSPIPISDDFYNCFNKSCIINFFNHQLVLVRQSILCWHLKLAPMFFHWQLCPGLQSCQTFECLSSRDILFRNDFCLCWYVRSIYLFASNPSLLLLSLQVFWLFWSAAIGGSQLSDVLRRFRLLVNFGDRRGFSV